MANKLFIESMEEKRLDSSMKDQKPRLKDLMNMGLEFHEL